MMDSIATPTEDLDHSGGEMLAVHDWRAEQLLRLGLPSILADSLADQVDWHAVADLVERGCALSLALDIVR
jgi:predicted component of type VI protein secretion system